jgi:aryl-alcohol dehydrogenase-like predicted oxidoreductase
MELRKLGRSGTKVSALGLGGNTFGNTATDDESIALIKRALDLGINFIDTADSYAATRSEELVGQAIAGRRHQVVLATKTGASGSREKSLSRRWLTLALEASLRRLNTDYIDLYYAHFPDADTPLDETLRAMDDFIRQGKVLYGGYSNHPAWQMAQGHGICERYGLSPWVAAQNRWNIIEGLEDPTLPDACRELGIGIIPYTPLASGILTGKYRRGEEPPPGTRMARVEYARRRLTDAKLAAVERLKPWCEERGHTTAELAVAWLLAHPEVSSVIVGARTVEQLEQNVHLANWVLTPDERDEATALAQGG